MAVAPALVTTVVGVGLAVAAGVFVVRTMLDDREEVEDALADAHFGWIALGLVAAAIGMTAIAVPWRRALQLVGRDMPLGQVVARYYLGELGKYIPGGLWPVVGRGELARRWGVPRPTAYSSVALSLAALYLAALFAVLVGLPALLAGDDGAGPLWVLACLPVGLAALHPSVLRWGLGLAERITRRPIELKVPRWRDSVLLVACYLPAWLAIGTATWVVARALDPGAPWAEIAVAAVLSWTVGFLLVPVPGGVGVREAAFVAAASSLDPGIAAAAALVARLLFVAVDAAGALLGSLALGTRLRQGREIADTRQ